MFKACLSRQKLLATALVFVLALTSATAALANEHYDHKDAHDKISKEFMAEIKATPEQRQQIETQHKEFDAQLQPLHEQLKSKKKALMEYLATPDSEKAQALEMQGEIDALMAQKSKLYIDHFYAKQSFLTPEQQKTAQTFMQKKMDEWGKKKKEMKEEMHDDM
ncbi:MAG: Spy/CpxP family protein refolding chaperone [Vampirovibrionales bacterium]|nr:Spy/CpxP family protein refolding chaperone [Vampirovibrionales bacterium]